ncbi:AAA family ATPase [Streptomyces sp. NPDC052701]|uniref:helix-turn-helix transcriptional regulator n=1 Tax=Streptomyces sp. NPDC052701 TaxID=3155533 RepID=UPI003442C193
MTLIERDRPIEPLEQLPCESAAGRGQVALINGGLASGKTALLDAFTDRTAASGALVLTASGSRAERTLQMGVLDQLFRGPALPPAVASDVARMVTVSAPASGEEDADSVTVRQPHVTRVHGICSVLLDLARERPLVIAVDDLHFVDPVSLQVLLYLQRRIRAARVMLVFTEWDHRAAVPVRSHAELTRRPHCLIKLSMLSRQAVAQLAAQHPTAAAGPLHAERLHQWSGGNPLLVHALLQDGPAGGQEAAGDTSGTEEGPAAAPGSAFRRAVLGCLHRWGPLVLEVGAGAGRAGRLFVPLDGAPADRRQTGHGRPDHRRAPGGRSAERPRLPAPGGPRGGARQPQAGRPHGAAPAGRVPAPRTRGRRLRVAHHLIAADRGERQWAADTLRKAAAEAPSVHRPQFAVQCLTLALGACVDEASRTAVREALMRIEWRANPSAAARHLAPLHEALNAGRLHGSEAALLARRLLWQGSQDAEKVTAEVLGGADATSDSETVAELRLTREWIHGSPRRPLRDASSAADVTLSRKPAKANGNVWAEVGATLTAALAARSSSRVAHHAEQILRSCRLGDHTLGAIACALSALVYADRADLAAPWCDSLRQQAQQDGATTWQAVLTALRADIHLRQGSLAEAGAQAREALELMPMQSWGVVAGPPLSIALLSDIAVGRHASPPDRAVPPAMFETVLGMRYLHARGRHHLAHDRVLAAVNDFQRCGDQKQQCGMDLPTLAPWRSDLALAHLRMNQTQTARELVEEELRRPGADNPRVRGHALRVLAKASQAKARSSLLRKAVDALQESGERLELSSALDELSQVHHEQGQYRRARVVARQTAQEARTLKVPELPQQRTRDEAEPAVAVSEPVLSGAERWVAAPAALGHTNREISRRLFITVSTVEQHLTRVYRELNVSGRADLPAGLTLHREYAVGSAGPRPPQAC